MSPERDDPIYEWWRDNIGDRNSGPARGLAARLRRAEGVEVLAEPEVHKLASSLRLGRPQADRLIRLAQVLAEVREHGPERLARRLGGSEPAMSRLRFQRLLRSREDDFTTQVRRALALIDRSCNVGALGRDLLAWDDPDEGDRVRIRWSFDYFALPYPNSSPTAQPNVEASL